MFQLWSNNNENNYTYLFFQDNQDSHVIPPDSVITNGISIILALLETRTAVTESNIVNDNNNDYGGNFTENMPTPEMSAEDLAKQTAILNNTLNAILPWLEDFTKLLTHPPNLTIMKTTAGILDPPLGQTRLRKLLFSFTLIFHFANFQCRKQLKLGILIQIYRV